MLNACEDTNKGEEINMAKKKNGGMFVETQTWNEEKNK